MLTFHFAAEELKVYIASACPDSYDFFLPVLTRKRRSFFKDNPVAVKRLIF